MVYRYPGMVCAIDNPIDIDAGTMCRTLTPAPGIARHAGVQRAARRAARLTLTTSDAGLGFIFSIEVGPLAKVTAHPHWPGGSSGVTLGPGYDMKERKEQDVAALLRSIGVPESGANAVARGAGLTGSDAEDFCEEHHDDVDLDKPQQLALLRAIVPHYEGIVRRNVKVAVAQHEFDALVCFVYNPGGSFRPVARCINNGETEQAAQLMLGRVITGGKANKGLLRRRERETALLLKGIY